MTTRGGKTIDDYKKIATSLHEGRYTYERWTTLGKYHDKIVVTCPKHGPFHPSLANHVTFKSGCPACRTEKRTNGELRRRSQEDWVDLANRAHGGKYSYAFPESFKNASKQKVTITCPTHGSFQQLLNDHIGKNSGCPECAKSVRIATSMERYGVPHPKQRHITIDVQRKLDDRDYLSTEHLEKQRTVTDISNELGISDGLLGRQFHKLNIPVRRFPSSTGEKEVADFVSRIATVVSSDRTVIYPLELDIYIPTHKIAIEYCGLYWHSDAHKPVNYHADKYNKCRQQGIRLITLFEDEWMKSQDLVKSKLSHIMNMNHGRTFGARSLSVVSVTSSDKRQFFNRYHIQGDGPSSVNYGLTTNSGELVACVGFISKSNNVFVLNRYATAAKVQGGFTRLLKHFQANHEWTTIETFADLRWSEGDLYTSSGFQLDSTLAPDYYWTDGNARWHKFGFRHKLLPSKLASYDPSKTEHENCKAHGLHRLFDCGKLKYTLVRHQGDNR